METSKADRKQSPPGFRFSSDKSPEGTMAVIGDRDSVLLFKSAGIRVAPASNTQEARKVFDELVEANFAVIFITEQLAAGMQDRIEEIALGPLPSVVLIPNNKGSLGLGLKRVRETVKKAVGADILRER